MELSCLESLVEAGFVPPNTDPKSPLLPYNDVPTSKSEELLVQALSALPTPDPLILSSLGCGPLPDNPVPADQAAPCPFTKALVHMTLLADGDLISTYQHLQQSNPA